MPRSAETKRRPFPNPQPATCCYPDKEGIRRVIQAKYPVLRQCDEAALTTSPELRGRLVVKFTVQADGTVPMACDSGSEITDPQTLDCMLRAFTDLRFPEQSGELCPKDMSIVYPIVFEPK